MFDELRAAMAALPAEVWKDYGPDNYGDGWVHCIVNQSTDRVAEFPCDFPEDKSHTASHPGCTDAKAKVTFCVLAHQHVSAVLAALDAAQAECERLKKLWCMSCMNTGYIDSDGCCGNCPLGRAKSQIWMLEESLVNNRVAFINEGIAMGKAEALKGGES